MKFLIFNLTVAAALGYLLTTDRTEIQNKAGLIHDAASEMKKAAVRVVDRGRRLVGQSAPNTNVRAPGRAEPPAKRAAGPRAKLIAPTPTPPNVPDMARADLSARHVAAFPVVPVIRAPVSRAPLKPEKVSAAEKRRAEVLRGIDPALLIPGIKRATETPQAEVSPALSSAERRKQLHALSEEMELFYARALGR